MLKKQDIKMLEGFYSRSVRRLARKTRRRDLGNMDIDKATKQEVIETAKTPTIEKLLRENDYAGLDISCEKKRTTLPEKH